MPGTPGFEGSWGHCRGRAMILFSKVDAPPLSGVTETEAIGKFLDEYTV
jgi:hypothetical protein